MAFEQRFHDPEVYFESGKDVLFKQKWNSISPSTTTSENANGSFECNICLDSANNPVVTLCGHLYCWPCIYKWLNVQNLSPESNQQQQNCPVCKAKISQTSLVPLYGPGTSSSDSDAKKPNSGLVIPRRPPPLRLNTQLTQNLFHSQSQTFHHHHSFTEPSTNINPTMFGEMVFARMFGSRDINLFTYPLMGSTNPRIGRQGMQLDKSLNRLSIFLFCFFILCLLSF